MLRGVTRQQITQRKGFHRKTLAMSKEAMASVYTGTSIGKPAQKENY